MEQPLPETSIGEPRTAYRRLRPVQFFALALNDAEEELLEEIVREAFEGFEK